MKFGIFFISLLLFINTVCASAVEKTKEEVLKDYILERIKNYYRLDVEKANAMSDIFIGNLQEQEIKSLNTCFSKYKPKDVDDKTEYYGCIIPYKSQLDMIIQYNK